MADDLTCGVKLSGTWWCFGESYFVSPVGDNTSVDGSVPVQMGTAATWTEPLLGYYFACAATVASDVRCTGRNTGGLFEAPLPDADPFQPAPVDLPGATWSMLAPGDDYSCGLRDDVPAVGELWCWGDVPGVFDGVHHDEVPRRVGDRTDWTSVAVGAGTTCAIAADSTVWCLGDPDLDGIPLPDPLVLG